MVSDNGRLRAMMNQDGAALLDTQRGTISTLNRTGAYIWQAAQRGDPAETIAAKLARETGAELQVVVDDVREFIDSLKENNLLSR